MLSNYYDILRKGRFNTLFGDLYIGQKPTPEKNSYLVLDLSFASLITAEGKERFIKSFDNCVLATVNNFLSRYEDFLKTNYLPENITGAEMAIRHIVYEADKTGKKIFVLIDEYDNFANDIIGAGDKEFYYDLLSGEGYIRAFYKGIKDGTAKSISRVFMTGVSPIMLDDLTSGFNIAKNLTMKPELNEMLGFTSDELKEVIGILKLEQSFDVKLLMKDMETYYNGYLFNNNGDHRVYNTKMVLYFLDFLSRYGKYPDNVLDANIKTDYKKVETLAFNFKDDELINELIMNGEITTDLVERFNLEYMYERKDNFASLLYYMGMLTIKESRFNSYVLCIPNYVIRTVYWDYFIDKAIAGNSLQIKNNKLSKAVEDIG
jgi:Predicted AAA-ATPase.